MHNLQVPRRTLYGSLVNIIMKEWLFYWPKLLHEIAWHVWTRVGQLKQRLIESTCQLTRYTAGPCYTSSALKGAYMIPKCCHFIFDCWKFPFLCQKLFFSMYWNVFLKITQFEIKHMSWNSNNLYFIFVYVINIIITIF